MFDCKLSAQQRIKTCGSDECRSIQRAKRVGSKVWNYKENPRQEAIHQWLTKTFGKPSECKKCGIKGEEKKRKNGSYWSIQWALITGKTYIRRKSNFIPLCSKCHYQYDFHIRSMPGDKNPFYGKKHTDEVKKNQSAVMKERLKDKTKHPLYGVGHTEETKKKISESHKKRYA